MITKLALLATVSVCLFVAWSTSAVAAVEFRSKATVETVKGKGTTAQEFKLGHNLVKCGELKHEDSSQKFPTEQLKEKVIYALCAEGGVETLATTCAEYNFHSNGTMTPSECKFESGLCKIKLVGNSPLGKVSYVNSSGRLEVKAAITGLEFSSSLGCPFNESGKTGEYTGTILDEGESGGTLEVK